jgi:chloramphenicol-sensitive protein RarD
MAPSTPASTDDARRGLAAVIVAFLIWGVLPLYLHLLKPVPVLQIMAHRLVWCCLFVTLWLAASGRFAAVGAALAKPGTRWRLLASALLISSNWLIYVWAVNDGHVIETSLGYFINPLVNVLFGVALLSERLNRIQWTAVGLAAAGVAWLTWQAGAPPWISLALALTFSAYGLIRKTVAVEAVEGLAAETLLIAPIGAAFLIGCELHGTGAFGHLSRPLDLWLFLSSLVTAAPLALFAYGARRIAYSTVGLCQYIGPTLQLLIGVFLFHEPFSAERAAGFALIWLALAIYAGEGLLRARRSSSASPHSSAKR